MSLDERAEKIAENVGSAYQEAVDSGIDPIKIPVLLDQRCGESVAELIAELYGKILFKLPKETQPPVLLELFPDQDHFDVVSSVLGFNKKVF